MTDTIPRDDDADRWHAQIPNPRADIIDYASAWICYTTSVDPRDGHLWCVTPMRKSSHATPMRKSSTNWIINDHYNSMR